MDKRLARAIERDNRREDAGMHPDERETCHTHQAWASDCEDRHLRVDAGRFLAQAREIERIRDARTDKE